ncbi:hypothetical protein HF313_16470 [Massilia atriviolacea]|uniref:Type III secretion protein n=1 Tax=Massilia atriviolacea TaxID=2495579 RepID=A0A430HU59_9BURK|nr:hypothetical protein [Massilia atriviolacea]RSZ61096.1 hypothetical protein EJB06_02925 [Massilia atriviolacea]
MSEHDQLARWLRAQPLGARVAIDGEAVWLRPDEGGAELAACLWPNPSGEQVQAALRQGFSSAQAFEAGLSLSDDGLLLSRWLPACGGWNDAAAALEQLLDQLAAWRASLGAAAERPRAAAGGVARHEQRMRQMLAGARP